MRSLLAFVAMIATSPSSGVPIHGKDDRRDLYEIVGDEELIKMARSTAALFDEDKVQVKDGTAFLKTEVFGEAENLVSSERFYDQPMGAFCSGALVGPDIVLTAGHCVTTSLECSHTKFVFDFSMPEKGHDPTKVPAENVYGCAKLLKSVEADTDFIAWLMFPWLVEEPISQGADWALVKLERPVKDREPLAVNRSGEIKPGMRVFTIGHPRGLPTKIAGSAKVRKGAFQDYFVTDLDIFKGNSGSPVFNAQTKLIEGIVILQKSEDFVLRLPRRRLDPAPADAYKFKSNVVSQDGGGSLNATKAAAFVKELETTLPSQNPSSPFDSRGRTPK